MKIGVDLDGVVYDSEHLLRANAELYDLKIKGKGLVDPSNWSIKKRHGWSDETNDSFDDIATKSLIEAPVMPLAGEVLRKLKEEGYEIYLITARGSKVETEIKITKKVLKRDKIKYDKLIFCKTTKLAVCQELGVDLMIEDKPKTIEELSKNGIKCFYFRSAELPEINNKFVTMVYNWGQIYRHIYKIGKGEK